MVLATLGPATCAAAGGANVNDVGEGTGEALALLAAMLVMFCSCFERRLKLGGSEADGRCLRVELARETAVVGGWEDFELLEPRERVEEVEGAWETRRESTGEAGAGRVEAGVSGAVVPEK